MTEFLDIEGGRIAYQVTGEGPLVVLSHGMGVTGKDFRFVAPALVRAGYRVAVPDMRGHGESSTGPWAKISRTDVAGDLVALIRHLGGPAVIVGHSLSGGAATIAAATAPDLVTGIVELNPFTKKQSISLGGLFTVPRYRHGLALLMKTKMGGSLDAWIRYLSEVGYPAQPADFGDYLAGLRAKLSEPGRMAEFLKTMKTTPADAGAQLGNVRCQALIIMGGQDSDWAEPRREAEAVVAAMPAGLGRFEIIPGAGHYPHAQDPERVIALLTGFLAERVTA